MYCLAYTSPPPPAAVPHVLGQFQKWNEAEFLETTFANVMEECGALVEWYRSGKNQNSRKTHAECHCVYPTSHMDSPASDYVPSRWEAGD
jgi:hypothetical protein